MSKRFQLPDTPGGTEAMQAIAELVRLGERGTVHGVVVLPDQAQVTLRVYLALDESAKPAFLALSVAKMLAVSHVTLKRAQARADERKKLLGLITRRR